MCWYPFKSVKCVDIPLKAHPSWDVISNLIYNCFTEIIPYGGGGVGTYRSLLGAEQQVKFI